MALRTIIPPAEQNKLRLHRAKVLIQNRRYPQARSLLLTIEHPIAAQWLRHLDEFELGNPFREQARANKWRHVVVAVVVLLVLLWFLFLVKDSYDDKKAIRQRLSGYYGYIPPAYEVYLT